VSSAVLAFDFLSLFLFFSVSPCLSASVVGLFWLRLGCAVILSVPCGEARKEFEPQRAQKDRVIGKAGKPTLEGPNHLREKGSA